MRLRNTVWVFDGEHIYQTAKMSVGLAIAELDMKVVTRDYAIEDLALWCICEAIETTYGYTCVDHNHREMPHRHLFDQVKFHTNDGLDILPPREHFKVYGDTRIRISYQHRKKLLLIHVIKKDQYNTREHHVDYRSSGAR